MSITHTHKQQYGHLSPKISILTPYKQVCIDEIGSHIIKTKGGTILDFMYLTTTYSVTSWYEILKLLLTVVTCKHKGNELLKVILDTHEHDSSPHRATVWETSFPSLSQIWSHPSTAYSATCTNSWFPGNCTPSDVAVGAIAANTRTHLDTNHLQLMSKVRIKDLLYKFLDQSFLGQVYTPLGQGFTHITILKTEWCCVGTTLYP